MVVNGIDTSVGIREKAKCRVCGKPITVARELVNAFDFFGIDMEHTFMCDDCYLREKKEREESEQKEIEKHYADLILSEFDIPAENRDNTFGNFVPASGHERIVDAVKAFVDNSDSILVMIGRNGNGKTHLAISWLKEECRRHIDKSFMYTTEQTIYDDLVATVSDKKAKASDVVMMYSEYDYLVIDEVCRVKSSEFHQLNFQKIIANRLATGRKTIMCGNVDGDHFKEYFNDNNLSRMANSGKMLKLVMDDYRRKKNG